MRTNELLSTEWHWPPCTTNTFRLSWNGEIWTLPVSSNSMASSSMTMIDDGFTAASPELDDTPFGVKLYGRNGGTFGGGSDSLDVTVDALGGSINTDALSVALDGSSTTSEDSINKDELSAIAPNSGTSKGKSGIPSSKIDEALVGTIRLVGMIISALGSVDDELRTAAGLTITVLLSFGNDFFGSTATGFGGGPTTTAGFGGAAMDEVSLDATAVRNLAAAGLRRYR